MSKYLLRVAAFFDLCGSDGRLSFSKLVLVTLIVGWLCGLVLDAALAGVFIGSSFGWKYFRLRLKNGEPPSYWPGGDGVE